MTSKIQLWCSMTMNMSRLICLSEFTSALPLEVHQSYYQNHFCSQFMKKGDGVRLINLLPISAHKGRLKRGYYKWLPPSSSPCQQFPPFPSPRRERLPNIALVKSLPACQQLVNLSLLSPPSLQSQKRMCVLSSVHGCHCCLGSEPLLLLPPQKGYCLIIHLQICSRIKLFQPFSKGWKLRS